MNYPLDSIWANSNDPEDRVRIIGYMDDCVVVWDIDGEAVSFIEAERLSDTYEMVPPPHLHPKSGRAVNYPENLVPSDYLGAPIPAQVKRDWTGESARWFRIGVQHGVSTGPATSVEAVVSHYRAAQEDADRRSEWEESHPKDQFASGGRFLDADGDVWTTYIDQDGARRATLGSFDPDLGDYLLTDIENAHGPLRKIDD